MDLSQLKYFLVTARLLHFARAARELGITQPALSRSILALEKQLGAMLFVRSNKWRISLTAAGKAFLPEAEKSLHQLETAAARARAAAHGETGCLSIGAISSALGKKGFLNALRGMARNHPAIAVDVLDSISSELIRQLPAGLIDLALLRLASPADVPDGFLAEKLCDDPLTVVLPVQHPLAAVPELSVRMLAREKFILVPQRTSPVFRNYICRFCEEIGGFSPRVSGAIDSSYTALRLTEAGMGITIVSESYEGVFAEHLCYRHFSDYRAELPLYAVFSPDVDSPARDLFLRLLKEQIRQDPGKTVSRKSGARRIPPRGNNHP